MHRTTTCNFEGGLESLRHHDHGMRGFWFFQADAATLLKWSAVTQLEVWQGVALHSGVDPDYMGTSVDDALRNLSFARIQFDLLRIKLGDRDKAATAIPQVLLLENVERVAAQIESGDLPRMDSGSDPSRAIVNIDELRSCMARLRLLPIDGWRSRSLGASSQASEQEAAEVASGAWPWGNHSTEKLEVLRRAAEHFLPRFERTKRWHRGEVVRWLIAELGAPDATAKACAALLRPAQAALGRHPKDWYQSADGAD